MAKDVAPNQVVLFGNLTADPVLGEIRPGQAVVNFHIAEETPRGMNFHKCVVLGAKAERFAGMYVTGDHLCVTGRLMSSTRPCKCCNSPDHTVVSWDVWVHSVGLSGMFDPAAD